MENDKKTALFVGGLFDGTINEIDKVEARLNWQGYFYISRGTLNTKQFETVHIYVLDGMKSEEEAQRIEIIKKVL